MALTLEDCDRIAEVVEKTGVKFMMGHQMRRDPANIAMKEIIDSGVLGKNWRATPPALHQRTV